MVNRTMMHDAVTPNARRARNRSRLALQRLTVRIRRFRRWTSWFVSNVKALLGLILVVGGVAALILLGVELARKQIEIQPFAVPKSLAEAGHPPEVAAARLRDSLDGLTTQATSFGGRALTVSMRGDTPDFVVPTVGLSLSTVRAYLEHFFGVSLRTTIGGELTLSKERVSMRLRLNDRVICCWGEAVTIDRLDDLWKHGAEAVMLEIRPYVVMLAQYNADPERATELADKIIGRYPDDDENVGWARLLKGLAFSNSAQYGLAEKQFDELWRQTWSWNPFATTPSFAQPALFYLGETLLNRGKAAEAYPVLLNAVRLDRTDPGARQLLGRALQALNKPSQADEQFRKTRTMFHGLIAKQQGVTSAQWHTGFSSSLLQQDKVPEALAQLQWAVEVDPDSDYARRRLCNGLLQAKQLARALEQCVKATQLGPKRFENHVALAQLLIAHEELAPARRAAHEALRRAPESPLVHEVLGQVQQQAGEFRSAEVSYRKAIELAPKAALFHADLASLFLDQKMFLAAAAEFRAARDLEPDSAVYRYGLAKALAARKDTKGAIPEYKAAIKLGSADPFSYLYYNDLGTLYFDHGYPDDALYFYKRAAALAPRDAVIQSNLGRALFEKGQRDAAIRQYRKAIALAPAAGDTQYRLGLALLQRDPPDAALTAFRMAIALDPEKPDPYGALSIALRARAKAAKSEAMRTYLLTEACRVVGQGLARTPDDPDMKAERENVARELGGCE
jgi:tetratricopeptide (TPR) repeat protein